MKRRASVRSAWDMGASRYQGQALRFPNVQRVGSIFGKTQLRRL
jgi:hypothetical protein